MTDDLDRAWRWTLVIVVAVTALRVLILNLTDLNLGPDEAQYWYWSTDLAAGYMLDDWPSTSTHFAIARILIDSDNVFGDGFDGVSR